MHVPFAPHLIAVAFLAALASPALAQDDKQETKKIPAELHGIWKLVIFGIEGREIKLGDRLPYWVIKDERVLYGGDPLAALTVDAATMPKLIDLTFDARRTFEGVYTVEGDRLTICLNQRTQGVKERPLDFITKDQPDRRLLIFQRESPDAGDGTQNSAGFVGIQFGIKAKEKTLYIVEVLPNSPALTAGLKKDDILLKVAGVAVNSLREVIDPIRQARPGSDVTLRIRRGDKEQDVTVRVRPTPFFLLDD
jgi:uncharacterized protein (TIGR03067 family)